LEQLRSDGFDGGVLPARRVGRPTKAQQEDRA
jgi:hypothetical protein